MTNEYSGNMNQTAGRNDVVEIDLSQVFETLLRHWMIIAGVSIICAVLSFVYFKFMAVPEYTADTNIMIINRQSEGTLSSSDLSSSTTLSSDYVEIIKNVAVLNTVIDNLGLDISSSELHSKISAKNISGTRMITISVTDENPELAATVADELADVSSKKICDVMNVENMVSIVNEAIIPDKPSYPTTAKYTVIAFILGFLVSAVLIVIIHMANDKIKTTEDVEKYLGLPTLGVIPVAGENEKGKKNAGHKTMQPEEAGLQNR